MPLINDILNNKNLQRTGIIAFGTIFGSFFSYLTQFFLGRILTISDFGTFTALISFSNLLIVPSSVFAISVVKRVAEYTANDDKPTTSKMFKSLSFWSLILGAVIFAVMTIFSKSISQKLNIENPLIIISFATYVGLSFFSTIPMAFIQGLMVYKRWAFFTSFSGFLRMTLTVLPALLGLGLSSVFLGTSVTVILCYLISILLLAKIFVKGESKNLTGEYKKLLAFGFSTLFVSLGLSSMNNIDMILVKKFFDSSLVGYYAGAVTVGKIFLFGSTAVATLMFPTISALYAQGKNFLSQLRQLFLIQLAFVAGGLFVFQLFPEKVTTLFFGNSFLSSVPYLRVFSLFIACYIFVYFLVMFFLAIEKTKVYFLLLPGVLLQYFLIVLNHPNIYQVMYAGIISAILTLVLLFLYLFLVVRKIRFN